MSKKNIMLAAAATILIIIAPMTSSLLFRSAAMQAGEIRWAVRLFPDNPDYVEVFVEVKNIASNKSVSEASFDVTFYEGKREVEHQTMNFLDQKLRSLGSGSYHRFFRHGHSGATRVEGGMFTAFGFAAGAEAKADVVPTLIAKAKESDWNSSAEGQLVDSVPSGLPGLEVLVHLQDIGDRTFAANEFAGTRGESRRLEGFQIRINPPIEGLGLQYFVRVRDKGDFNAKDGEFAGTRGESLPVEEFAIHLTGPAASRYDIFYMAHIEDIGDTPLFKNGEFCGSRGQRKSIEGILVRLRAKPSIRIDPKQ